VTVGVSRAWTVAVVAAALAALAVFLVLNDAFGGPSPIPDGHRVLVQVEVADAQRLVTKSPVLVRGVPVGEVRSLRRVGGRIRATLAIDPERTPLWRDASARVGRRTLFGEAYVRLDPGHRRAGPARDGARLATSESIELDEALEALDEPTRRHLRSLARTGARVATDPRAAARANATLGAVPDAVAALRRLDRALVPQTGDLRALVADAAAVTGELDRREAQVRRLVAGGRDALGALAAAGDALPEGLAEARRLLRAGDDALRAAEPVIAAAEPLLPRLERAAAPTTAALRALPATADGVAALAAALPRSRRAVDATLPALRTIAADLPALTARLVPVLRNAVPIVRYLEPFGSSVVGFVGGGTAIRELRDDGTARAPSVARVEHLKPFAAMGEDGAPYGWARFFVDVAPGVLLGQRTGGVATNPYPRPTRLFDAFSGTYPRLEPEPEPPLRR